MQQWAFSTSHHVEIEDDGDDGSNGDDADSHQGESSSGSNAMEDDTQRTSDDADNGDDEYDESDVIAQSAEQEEAESTVRLAKTVKCTARCKNGCLKCKCRKTGELCDSSCNCSGCQNRAESPEIQNARDQWSIGTQAFTVPSPPSNTGPKSTPSSVLDAFATVFPEEMWDHLVSDTQNYYDSQPQAKQKPAGWTCSKYK